MDQRYDENPSEELEQFDQDAPQDLFDVEEDEPKAPVMVRIRLNGKTIEVTEEQAQIIEEHEAERQRVISRMGNELGELRRRPAPEQRPEPQVAENPDLEWFQSPAATMAKHLKEAEERAYARIKHDQELAESRQKYWGKFYADNKDLADHDDVIQFLVTKHFDELKDLSPAESHRELAKRANAFLGRQAPAGKTLPNRPAQSERPSGTVPARQAPAAPQPKPHVPLSAQLVEARREQRRQAQYRIKEDNK